MRAGGEEGSKMGRIICTHQVGYDISSLKLENISDRNVFAGDGQQVATKVLLHGTRHCMQSSVLAFGRHNQRLENKKIER